MTWNYRLIRHANHLGLHEVFYDDAGKVTNWTADPVTFVADSDEGAAGIIGALENALADARRYSVLIAADLPQ